MPVADGSMSGAFSSPVEKPLSLLTPGWHLYPAAPTTAPKAVLHGVELL